MLYKKMLSSVKSNPSRHVCIWPAGGAIATDKHSGVKLRQVSVELKGGFWDFHCSTRLFWGLSFLIKLIDALLS